MANQPLDLDDARAPNVKSSLSYSGKNIPERRKKTSLNLSRESSYFTMSTEGGVNVTHETCRTEDMPETPSTQTTAYRTGHILNELTTAAWYSYMLIYFQNVVGLSPVSAGLVFLISQLVRAATTFAVGFGFDKHVWRRFAGYGTREARHLFGSAGILFSWPLIFAPCLVDSTGGPDIGTVIYYLLPVLLFSACWPLVELSNASLVAEAAKRDKDIIRYHSAR